MTTHDVIKWILENVGADIDRAITEARVKNPDLLYDKPWLAGMAYRETGFLIARYAEKKMKPAEIYPLMRGDFGQREGEKEKIYHGYGIWQIDIGSFPAFVKSGDWKDPYKTCVKAISVLEGKRIYLQGKVPALAGDDLHRAITAAYNCGEGNVLKVLAVGSDIDARTHEHNYSKKVWEYRDIATAV